MKGAMLTLYAAAYLHPGASGATSAIDLPVQREVHTNLPVIPASGLKGALRQKAGERLERGELEAVFGPDTLNADKHAGSLLLGEAKLLALPIRSLRRVFYWVSSPLALNRLGRDLARIGTDLPQLPEPREGVAMVPPESADGKLVLEELDFEVRQSVELGEILRITKDDLLPAGAGEYLLDKFTRDFALVTDDEFRHLCRVGTQVSARVQLKENKTSNNFWYEESLPPETIFHAVVLTQGSRGDRRMGAGEVMGLLDGGAIRPHDGLVQVGGNETVGQGWCYARLFDGAGGL